MVESDSKTIILQKLKALKDSPFQTIIFGLSGSVASIKAKDIAQQLLNLNLNVILI